MSSPFLSEIRIMSFNFPPKNWTLCNGQTLSISQYSALFSLIGTTYGGNGVSTFLLPNLQGRVPIHGTGTALGLIGGEENHLLNINEMPSHNHSLSAKAADAETLAAGRQPGPTKALAESHAVLSNDGTAPISIYGTGAASIAFASNAVASNGGGQAHENRQPFLVLNFCIALQGIFPSRN